MINIQTRMEKLWVKKKEKIRNINGWRTYKEKTNDRKENILESSSLTPMINDFDNGQNIKIFKILKLSKY